MGPRIESVDRTSQATPLAEDFIKVLQGQMARGQMGMGVGPLQRGAGTAIEQFVNSGLNRVNSGGVSQGTDALINALMKRSETSTNRAAGNQREAFGAAGARFGTTLANSEALLRGEAQAGLDQTVGNVLMQQQQFDTNTLMQAINQMFQQGEANLNPFLQLASLGIIPNEIIASPGVGDQILAGILNAGGEFAGRS